MLELTKGEADALLSALGPFDIGTVVAEIYTSLLKAWESSA